MDELVRLKSNSKLFQMGDSGRCFRTTKKFLKEYLNAHALLMVSEHLPNLTNDSENSKMPLNPRF